MHSPCPDFKAVQDAIWLVDRFRSSSTRLQTLRCSMILKMIPTRNGIYAYHKWVQLYPNEYERNPPIRADDSHRFDHVSWVFFNNFMSDILQFGGLNLPLGLEKTPVGWQHLVFVAWFEYLHLNIKFKDVLFPLVGWLLEGFEEPPEKQQVNDDRWYTKPAPLHCVLVKPRLFEVNSAFLRLQSPFLLVRPTIPKPWVFTKINR